MKKYLLAGLLAMIAFFSNAQSVSINTDGSTAAPSAMLDVKSTTKGMLVPRMTTTQRTAIPMPANGLLVYDTDLNNFYFYNGSQWATFSSGNGSFTLPFSQSLSNSASLLDITNNGTGDVIKVTSKDGNGILATSTGNSAIKAIITDISNFNPSFRALHEGYGPAITAISTYNHGIIGAASDAVRGGIVGINTGTGAGVIANSANGTALVVEGNVKISGGNTNPSFGAVLTSDAEGNATWKENKIAFRATGLNSNFQTHSGNGAFSKLHLGGVEYNHGGGFEISFYASPSEEDGAYTVPVSGVFHLEARTKVSIPTQDNFQAKIQIKIKRNGMTFPIASSTTQSAPIVFFLPNGVSLEPSVSTDYMLNEGDLVFVEISTYSFVGTDAAIDAASTVFTGHMVFAN